MLEDLHENVESDAAIYKMFRRLRRDCGWVSAAAAAVGGRRTLLRVLLRFVNIIVIVLVIVVVELVRRRRTAETQRLSLAVVEARGADALAARVDVEPAIACRSHRLARLAASTEGQARRHVGDCTVGGVGGPVYGDQVITVPTNFASVRIYALCHTISKSRPVLGLIHTK